MTPVSSLTVSLAKGDQTLTGDTSGINTSTSRQEKGEHEGWEKTPCYYPSRERNSGVHLPHVKEVIMTRGLEGESRPTAVSG